MFLGSKGWVHVDRERIDAGPKSLLKEKIGPEEVQLFSGERDGHHGNFIKAIKGLTQVASPIDAAVRSDALTWLDQIAIKLGRKLRWDPEVEGFVNDDEANRLLDRPMRAPWRLDGQSR
jgi:hypothetical protein